MMIIVLTVTMIACVYGFVNLQNQMIQQNLSLLRISLNQLENVLTQIDDAFVRYVNSDASYTFLKNCTQETPREETITYEADARSWLSEVINVYPDVQGGFVYYEKMDRLLFSGESNYEMRLFIENQLRDSLDAQKLNTWQFAEVDGDLYLYEIFGYNAFYGGLWIPVSELEDQLGITGSEYLGTVYLCDENFVSTLQESYEASLSEVDLGNDTVTIGNIKYRNHTIQGEDIPLSIGMLIPRNEMIFHISPVIKIIFIGAVVSVILVILVIFWLKKRIAQPVYYLDEAMKEIAEGNLDYRLPLSHLRSYNEFDRLAAHLNMMMDELEETQFKLYETTIREKDIKMKYISQQIRPHFILNALNIIYTYDESEFPLIKKMVMYLTNYFRYVINLKVDFVEVWQELAHVENYLKIQKARYPDRFEFFVEYDNRVKTAPIPPLIIQTFVENSVKYGMSDEKMVFFYVLAGIEDEQLFLFIADTGNGYSDDAMEKIRNFIDTRQPQDNLGVGICNAIERMDILYHGNVKIEIKNALTGGATVKIFLPMNVIEKDK